MSRKERPKKNLLLSEHHLTPRSKRGRGKDKKIVSHEKHRAWHTLVKDALPDEAAEILSGWIKNNSKFFAITKGESIHKTVQEINQWIKGSDVSVKVISKKQPKIIRFRSLENRLFPKIVS